MNTVYVCKSRRCSYINNNRLHRYVNTQHTYMEWWNIHINIMVAE